VVCFFSGSQNKSSNRIIISKFSYKKNIRTKKDSLFSAINFLFSDVVVDEFH